MKKTIDIVSQIRYNIRNSSEGGRDINIESANKNGKDVGFERIRRITGYLVGTMDKWNDAKKAEERDRVKHSLTK